MTNNAPDQRRGSAAAVWLVVAVVLLLVLYVLSAGPAVRLFDHRGSPYQPYVAAFYWPLIWLADMCQPIGNALQWYVSLWQP
jgi:hypothetical protein